MRQRFGIAEWYGRPFGSLDVADRHEFAEIALDRGGEPPPCPFQPHRPVCRKRGGVCSIQSYSEGADGRIGSPVGPPVITCPRRFEEGSMLARWLADIVGFDANRIQVASEVPFLRSTATGKAAGKIDMVVAERSQGAVNWYGLEIQAVYFSGEGMDLEFRALHDDSAADPPFPSAIRRPDWRSSSAKRLMPQLQIKGPTLRRWGTKLAVAVDRPFFDSIGGSGENPARSLSEGDVIWLVPELRRFPDGSLRLVRGHWEALTLEDTSEKLLAAETMKKEDFDRSLETKLRRLE